MDHVSGKRNFRGGEFTALLPESLFRYCPMSCALPGAVLKILNVVTWCSTRILNIETGYHPDLGLGYNSDIAIKYNVHFALGYFSSLNRVQS
jgi:hypothetical protein